MVSTLEIPDATTPSRLSDWFATPDDSALAEAVGFRHAAGGVHLSKTMMLAELTAVMDSCPDHDPDPRAEAARVLQAKLAAILEGEKPYDIFVHWKPLEKQPLGWDPDLDDDVRLNIRPFIEAGVLAHAPNVKYGTDRGKDVPSAPWFPVFNGERRNDHHTTLAEKRAARTATRAVASTLRVHSPRAKYAHS